MRHERWHDENAFSRRYCHTNHEWFWPQRLWLQAIPEIDFDPKWIARGVVIISQYDLFNFCCHPDYKRIVRHLPCVASISTCAMVYEGFADVFAIEKHIMRTRRFVGYSILVLTSRHAGGEPNLLFCRRRRRTRVCYVCSAPGHPL